MSGLRLLYIDNEQKVYRIPQPKNVVFKPMPGLANQDVLLVTIFYETKQRKPWKFIRVFFDRLKLDDNGQYILTDETLRLHLEEAFLHIFSAEEEDLITIPMAPCVPTVAEKEALVAYIKDKLPDLWKNNPERIEESIKRLKSLHKEKIERTREVARSRKSWSACIGVRHKTQRNET